MLDMYVHEAGKITFYSYTNTKARSDISLNWHIHPAGQGDSIPAPHLGQKDSTSLAHQNIATKLSQTLLDIITITFKTRLEGDLNILIKRLSRICITAIFAMFLASKIILKNIVAGWRLHLGLV